VKDFGAANGQQMKLASWSGKSDHLGLIVVRRNFQSRAWLSAFGGVHNPYHRNPLVLVRSLRSALNTLNDDVRDDRRAIISLTGRKIVTGRKSMTAYE
jgi:hypothetical protein